MLNTDNSSNSTILLLLQSLNLLMEKDVKDRKSWLPGFSGGNYKENYISELEEKISGNYIHAQSMYSHSTANPTSSSEELGNESHLRKSQLSNNTIPPPALEKLSREEKDKSIDNKNETEKMSDNTKPVTHTSPPPAPPPPPPLPQVGNIMTAPSPSKPRIRLEASPTKTEFFTGVASIESEKFNIPKIGSPTQFKKVITTCDGNVEHTRSNVMEDIAEVGLKKQIQLTAEEIHDAIMSFNFKNLSYDAIETLLEIVRSAHPGTLSNSRKKGSTYHNVLNQIEDGKEILKSMLFFKTFDSEFKRLQNQFSKIKEVCESLIKSANQPIFCQLFRNIIGFVEEASGNIGHLTNGFKIETLSAFWETKPFNGKSSMSVFVENLVKNNSGTLLFYEDFDFLDTFTPPDPVEMRKDLKGILERLEKAKNTIEKLSTDQPETNFADILATIPHMESRTSTLQTSWNSAEEAYSNSLTKFGQTTTETEKELATFSLIEILQRFIKEFKYEKQNHEAARKKMESSTIRNTLPKAKRGNDENATRNSSVTGQGKSPVTKIPLLNSGGSELENAIFNNMKNCNTLTGPGNTKRIRKAVGTENRSRDPLKLL